MKLIIAGSRDFDNYPLVQDTLETLYDTGEIEFIVCGGARGADELGKKWAHENNIPVVLFPAKWEAHGKAAGFIRNAEMANYADKLLAFWDGQSRGTRNMMQQMKKREKPYEVVLYD